MANRWYVIIVFLAIVNSLTCSEKSLSPETISLLHEALEAFNIPKQSITLHAGKTCAASPSEKQLCFHQSKIKELDTFVAYHEAAYLADPELQKVINKHHGKLWSGYLAGFISVIASSIPLSAQLPILDIGNPIANISAGLIVVTLAHISGLKAGSYFTRSSHIRAEHFANIQACKKLIEKNNYLPILVQLHYLKMLEYCGVEKTSYGHPPVAEESSVMENYLKEYRISVRYFQPYKEPSLQSQLFIKNKLECWYETIFDAAQLHQNFSIPWWQKLIE